VETPIAAPGWGMAMTMSGRKNTERVIQDAGFDLTGFNEIATQVAGTCGTTFQPAK